MYILCFVGKQLFLNFSTKNIIENTLSKRNEIYFCLLLSLVLVVSEYILKNMLKRIFTLYGFTSPGQVCETFNISLLDFIEYWLHW